MGTIHSLDGHCASLTYLQLEALYRHQITHGPLWLHRLSDCSTVGTEGHLAEVAAKVASSPPDAFSPAQVKSAIRRQSRLVNRQAFVAAIPEQPSAHQKNL